MRLILEKSEIVAILGKHFDAELDPEKVIIRTDPFEVEVCGLPMTDTPREETNVVPLPASRTLAGVDAQKFAAKKRDDPDATTDAPPPGNDGTEVTDESVHPASVLAASKALELELDKKNPQLGRRSGRWSEIAPTDSKDEIE